MMRDILGNAQRRSLLFFIPVLFVCSSCAVMTTGSPRLQPEVNSLVVANRLQLAADMIEREEASYGPGNYLLYYLDRGLVEFYAGRYEESVRSLEKAKQRFQELYTESLSKEFLSWAVNDYMLPYRGADHEYVLVNIFQALNFLSLKNPNESLVEARDLNSKYQVVTDLAHKMKRRRYEDNGFARMFMGLLYQSMGRPEDKAEALLWYKEALSLYASYYEGQYVPQILKEEAGRLAEEFSDDDLAALRQETRGSFASQGYENKAKIIVLQLAGYSPLKVADVVPIPVDRQFIIKLAFPKYMRRYYDIHSARVIAYKAGGARVSADTELGMNIEELAMKDLESRKATVLAKAVLRPAMKYLIERKQKEVIDKKSGAFAAEVFGLMSNLYNVFSEQADLRSWQALPAQIRVARIFVDPGTCRIQFDNLDSQGMSLGIEDIGEVTLEAGETRFIVVRSTH
ncbi:MAG: hypothetical protein HQL21_01905 [Candidatus Omnitrophica bacterium]|nr:hypothetical protein [Candidatus Omnitrophota bacterium]